MATASPALTYVVSALPSLSMDELKALQATIERLVAAPTVKDPEAPTLLYRAALAELEAVGHRSSIPYYELLRSRQGKAWQRGMAAVNDFLKKCGTKFKTDIDEMSFLRVAVSTLIKQMRRRKIPLSVGSLASNLEALPDAFDRAFPHYVENGLAHLVIEALVH